MKQIYLCLLWLGGVLMSLLPINVFAQISSMVISEKGNFVSSRCPMNWNLTTSRSQAFYPAEILNLPKGTLIHSISFLYNTWETQSLGFGGDIKISLGEVTSVSQGDKSFIEGLQLVYSGSHQMKLTSYAEKEVSYAFSTAYEYKGGILVIEVSNMDSPRSLSEKMNIGFRWNRYLKNTYSIEMSDDASIRNNTGVPAVTIGFEQKGSSPILYVPFSERDINLGSLAANEAKLVYVPIMNQGNARLITETVSNGSTISIPAIEVGAQESAMLAVQVTPEAESSFKESITLNSNGGKADFTFRGMTYQVRKASTVVNLAEAGSLRQVSTDIAELSILGEVSYSDWNYICANFKYLRYLDLSDARFYSNYFPNSNVSMACASTLERLCLPANMEYLESGSIAGIGITMLRDIVLPPGFVGISGNISDWSSFSSLENLISLAPEPVYVDKEFLTKFTNVYVPKNAIESYQEDYKWSQSNLSVITEEALNGNKIREFSLEFTEDGNQYTSGLVIDWYKEVTKTQLLYPAKLLNIPKGALIKSVKLRFKIKGDQISNGTMRILCAEKNYENVNGLISDGQICYEGSDNLDCSILDEKQLVTYEFKQPYEYKGEGDFVLCFENHRPSNYADNMWVNTAFNKIDDIHCWSPRDEETFYETDEKPDITLNVKLNSEEPYLFIPLKNRILNCGYAPMSEEAVVSLPVRNLGGKELYIENLFCDGNSSFGIDAPVIIPANSSRFINVRYNSTMLTSVVEKGLLSSNGGAVELKLIGTGMRQVPYEKDIMNLVITPGTTLRRLISDIMKEADWGQITELSVTGTLSEDDILTLRSFPNLRLLDLSTATVSSTNVFWEDLYDLILQLEQLALPLNLSDFDNKDLTRISKLTKLVLPVGFRTFSTRLPEQLTSLILLSPEPPEIGYRESLQFVNTIYVPENVIGSYRVSSWNQDQRDIFPITEEILSTDWTGGPILIKEDKVYDESNYPGGNPDILIQPDNEKGVGLTASLWNKVSLKAKSLTLGNQLIYRNRWSEEDLFYDWSNYASFINDNARAVVDTVGYMLRCGTNNWHYLSFPFDFSLSEIKQESVLASEYVFRSYDGASRAVNGLDKVNNWKDVSSEGILKAGKGYIFQCNRMDNQFFLFVNNADNASAVKSFMSTEIKVIPLEEHPITDPEKIDDKNWNFIGNPYPSFFNIHYIEGYTAPLIIWNGEGYVALSTRDDNYALRPLEAFFTQKPDGVSEMRFNPVGRQVNSVITNPVDLRASTLSSRLVINLRLVGKDYTDRSRVVINPKAKVVYELDCDAVKWSSPNTELPQFYTMDDAGRHYAINERPISSGVVPLGFYVGVAGEYRLEIPKEERDQPIFLVDKYRDKEVDLSKDTYTFFADKGTFDDRFELQVFSVVTSFGQIEEEKVDIYVRDQYIYVQAPANSEISVYSVTGKQLIAEKITQSSWSRSFPAGIYLVRVGETSRNLIIH